MTAKKPAGTPLSKGGRPRKEGPRDAAGHLLKGGDKQQAGRETREAKRLASEAERQVRLEAIELADLQQQQFETVMLEGGKHTQEDLWAIFRREFDEAQNQSENMLGVLAQPHRRSVGSDPYVQENRKAENALGRFVIAHRMRSDTYKAGMYVVGLHERLNGAWGGPRGPGVSGDRPSGLGKGPTTETAAEWRSHLKEINRAVEATGTWPAKWVRQLVLENLDLDLQKYEAAAVIDGLKAMTEAVAKIVSKDL